MIKIAFVTPWPPQHSGIADHVYAMVSELKNSFHIDIITNEQNPQALDGVKIYHHQEQINYHLYHKIIYEIGNSYEFHGYMIPLLKKYHGILHLHDVVLHHFMAQYCFETQRSYLDLIEKWYGYNIRLWINELKEIHHLNFWETKEVALLPLCEELLEHSKSCIVHSNYALNQIKALFPQKEVVKTWLFPPLDEHFIQSHTSKNIFHIGVFGNVDKNRHIVEIIGVINQLSSTFHIQLHIVGNIDNKLKYLMQKHQEKENIHFYGRVNNKKFDKILSDTDICINLRYPTMGETSSIAIRCLQRGIVLIVNDTGWYSELPSFVTKIPVEKSSYFLKKELTNLLDHNKINKIKKETKEFLLEELNIEQIGNEYIEIINTLCLDSVENEIYNRVSDVLNDLEYFR